MRFARALVASVVLCGAHAAWHGPASAASASSASADAPSAPASSAAGVGSASGGAAPLPLPELAARVSPSVVLLTELDASGKEVGSGTGFFVTADGRIVTNHHVIEGASAMTATLVDGRVVPVTGVITFDAAKDIAVVQAQAGTYPPLTLADSRSLRVGDDVVVVGSPLGLSAALSIGIVSALRDEGLKDPNREEPTIGAWSLQHTAAISPGSSGSPIMNRRGEVVGIVVGRMNGGEGVNFGIRVEVARQLVDATRGAQAKPFAEAPPKHAVLRNLAISAAFFAGIGALWFVIRRLLERRERSRPRGGW
jgi:putative serine protease PepD